MVDNPAIHELNNIEVRGGDTDFQVVNIEGTSEDILLEYNDATDEWDIRGTVSDLDVADLEYEFGLHQTEINEDKEIPEGQGSVIAGPLTGEGEITGEGNLAVVDDVQDAVRNPVQENVDFNSNDATGISALEAEQLNTDPTGALVQLDGDQSLADATTTDVEWETESSRGEVSDLLDTSNNVVVVPEGFDFAKVKLNYDVGNDGPAIDLADPRRNGSTFAGGPAYNDDQNGLMRSVDVASAWFPVSENDEISSRIRVQGTDVSLNDNDRTYMEIWLI